MLSLPRGQIHPLVRELGSHKLHSIAPSFLKKAPSFLKKMVNADKDSVGEQRNKETKIIPCCTFSNRLQTMLKPSDKLLTDRAGPTALDYV